MGMFKRGLEPTITTVLLVLISLIAVAIIAVFVFPLIRNGLDDGGCSEAINSIDLQDSDYTCIASSSSEVFTGFSIKANHPAITGFVVSLYHEGTAIPVEIAEGATSETLRMLGKGFGQSLEVRNDGSTRTYVTMGAYERIDVSPIMESGKVCQSARSVVNVKQCLDPSIRGQLTSQGSGSNATCGNNIIESGEICDGNTQSCTIGGYAGIRSCSSSCSWNSCIPTESCGDSVCNGPETASSCAQDCQTSTCGNGLIDFGEECDLGILNSPHGACTTQCTNAICGDGLLWNMNGGTEQCDAGNSNSNNPNSCRLTCQLPTCGDNICDNGYGETTSSCSQDCGSAATSCQLTGAYWETNAAIEGQSVSLHVTGDNCNGKSVSFIVKEDDGLSILDDDVTVEPANAVFVNGVATTTWVAEWQDDGLWSQPEYYFTATEIMNVSNTVDSGEDLVVSRASASCGDGILDAGESCDDHNVLSGDGCSSACFIENGYSCSSQPSTCSCNSGDSDGDGVCNSLDNCPATSNSGQQDFDGDGLGNVCDSCPNDAQNDIDGDGICGDLDNCPAASNPGQQDSNSNGVGDVCESNLCGNNIIEMGEECDGINLNPLGTSCTSYTHFPPYTSGSVFCQVSCTINFLGCGYCGDGIVNGGEACDGTNFGSHTNQCTNYTHVPPYSGGTVLCTPSCTVSFGTCTSGAGQQQGGGQQDGSAGA